MFSIGVCCVPSSNSSHPVPVKTGQIIFFTGRVRQVKSSAFVLKDVWFAQAFPGVVYGHAPVDICCPGNRGKQDNILWHLACFAGTGFVVLPPHVPFLLRLQPGVARQSAFRFQAVSFPSCLPGLRQNKNHHQKYYRWTARAVS